MRFSRAYARPVAKLLLLDGNSLTYRAFFALPTDMATASGQVTNAVFGFTSMLINLVRDQRPDGVVVLFDRPEPTFRHDAVPEYKAQREAAPDILRQQMGLVREIVTALGIAVADLEGYEADDLIATLATRARDTGHDVVIVTGDRDTYQLVEDPHVAVLYNRRGVSDYVLYDEAGIKERTGVTPAQYPEYAALRGDPSDNLAGVPGVGEKTAAKLVTTYGGLDGIFENVAAQTPKLRESLAANEARVRKNADVMVLRRDAPIDLELSDVSVYGVRPPDLGEVKRLFEFLEFRSLFERLAEVLDAPIVATRTAEGRLSADVTPLDVTGAAAALAALATGDEPVAIAPSWAGAPGRSAVRGIALATPDSADALWIASDVLVHDDVRVAFGGLVGREGPGIRAHDAKSLMRALPEIGLDIAGLRLDTIIAAYLLDPAESRYAINDLLMRYTGLELGVTGSQRDAARPRRQRRRREHERGTRGGCHRSPRARPRARTRPPRHAVALRHDREPTGTRPRADGARRRRRQRARATRPERSPRSECRRLDKAIQEEAGIEFNVNSTPQLREVLFDKLGLAPQKKTKTGYSTDAASLERIRDQHPIIDLLLSYREVEKLRSTYGEGLLNEVAADGRIHASFNQTVARTGRLSSDQPNLHNIPVRSDGGRQFRTAFVPAPGYEMLVADYNQIELRCIAHLAEDPGLIAAFEAGTDIHTETASRVFSVDPKKVSVEQRAKAKMVSYGLAYGMEAFGLGQRLNIPTEEAAEILDAYFVAFPSVKRYMEGTVNEARQRGYTETLFGRRRPIPELSSPNYRIRQAGERQAMNAGIQGLAADIFKVALVELDHELEARQLGSRLILQVHDEVILEVAPHEHDEVAGLTRTVMEGAVELRVPLEVHLAFGPSWADAKG